MNRSLNISSVAYALLAQKGDCWTWNQRLWEARVLSPLGVTFCHWILLFSCSKDQNAFSYCLWKTQIFHFYVTIITVSNGRIFKINNNWNKKILSCRHGIFTPKSAFPDTVYRIFASICLFYPVTPIGQETPKTDKSCKLIKAPSKVIDNTVSPQ